MGGCWCRAYVAVALLLVIVLSACGGRVPVSDASTPATTPADPIAQLPVNETVSLPGLGATTDVVYDEIGIPHVYAPDMDTATYVQGYLIASVRFWQMDVIRRFAEGRLSEVFGKVTLNTDVGIRTMFTTRDGRRLEEALWENTQRVDPEVARLAEAYTAGINAWLADLRAGRNGASLPPEYTLPFVIGLTANDLADWRPQDTVAVGRLQAFSLSDTSGEEINRAHILRALPDTLVRDVFRSAPAAPTTVLPVAQPRKQGRSAAAPEPYATLSSLPDAATLAAAADALAALHHASPFGSKDRAAGSNNWVVAPALSANGHAMLANDPHLALFNPPIWHMIDLNAESERMHVNGVIFPGLPGVILGHNDFGAWGATVAGYDVSDVYIEDVATPADYPSSPRTVLFKGERVPVLRIEETFNVKNASPVTYPIEVVPHHGPMLPDPNLRDQVVGLAATGMTIRWTGHEITNDSRFLFDLIRARGVSDFNAALRNFATGAQNWVWADVDGNIAYSTQVLVPQRPAGVIPYLPVSGVGDAEWLTDAEGHTLWLPNDKIPQAVNPPGGFVNTSNNDQVGNTLDNNPLNDDVYFAYTFDLGFRAQRVEELLSNAANVRPAGAGITATDMSHYQYDNSSEEAVRLLPFLFAARANRPDLVDAGMFDALSRLRDWATAKPGSPLCDALSGIDAHALRDDIAPRGVPVSEDEHSDAIATSIFAGWLTRLARAVFTDDFAGSGIGIPGGDDAAKGLLHILEDIDRTDGGFRVYTKGATGESTLWDDQTTPQVETRDEVLLVALRDGLTFLEGKFATAERDAWSWGLIHQVRLQHFVGQAGLPIFDLGPFAAGGSRFTVNPAHFSLTEDDFEFTGGPSMRFVVVLDPAGIRAVNSLPGGNNGDPGGMASENYTRINPAIHYGDLMPGWVNGQTFEYHISRADIAAHAVRKIRYAAGP